MPRWKITTHQEFEVSYLVDGDNPQDAWEELMDGDGDPECVDQHPGRMTGSINEALIEEA